MSENKARDKAVAAIRKIVQAAKEFAEAEAVYRRQKMHRTGKTGAQ